MDTPGGRGGKGKLAAVTDESPVSVGGLTRFLSQGEVHANAATPVHSASRGPGEGARLRRGYGSVAPLSRSASASFLPRVAPVEDAELYDVEATALVQEAQPLLPKAAPGAGGAAPEPEADGVSPAKKARLRNLLAPESLALPLAYFFIGICTSFITTPLQVYMVQELGAEPAAQNTLSVLTTLPWSFKLLFGFLSDVRPLCGARRKPYMIVGSAAHAAAFLALAYIGRPSMQALSTLLFIATMGEIMVDVMADTLVVERAAFEPAESRGQTQATCYALRFFGSVLGAGSGAIVYNTASWGWGLSFAQVCFALGVLPLVVLVPFAPMVWERPLTEAGPKTVSEQCRDIWSTVQLESVWKPMAFVYTYNVLQIPNVAWSSFLQLDLHFESFGLGMMATIGAVMTFLGIMAFKRWFFHASWRYIYLSSTVLCTVFSLLQLLLIFHVNRAWGVSDYVFALGDDVMAAYINGIQFLPLCIMYSKLCPGGSEGATYAMLTTFGNIAWCVAATLGSLLTQHFDVSNHAIREGDMDGMWKITVLTSALSLAPLSLIWLLPLGHKEQLELQSCKSRWVVGGVAFLVVLLGSLAWTSGEALATVLSE